MSESARIVPMEAARATPAICDSDRLGRHLLENIRYYKPTASDGLGPALIQLRLSLPANGLWQGDPVIMLHESLFRFKGLEIQGQYTYKDRSFDLSGPPAPPCLRPQKDTERLTSHIKLLVVLSEAVVAMEPAWIPFTEKRQAALKSLTLTDPT
ncbi:hypothetical protein EVAR_38331_1 [Eumeta japonica]|uniref:Uncharacterized protein n=1 Tax=Eumeta variegata TaxID=151549 RepID=A0A4C1X7M2_EUMVA|nr:hypothetical protein EVAR_38331_1 [Eumeta japonica]